MESIREAVRNSFYAVTWGASILGAILWVSAGSIAVVTGDLYSYTLVGILAMLAQAVAVTSAKKEGYQKGVMRGILYERSRED